MIKRNLLRGAAVFLSCCLVFTSAGCGKKSKTVTTESTTKAVTEQETKKNAGSEEQVTIAVKDSEGNTVEVAGIVETKDNGEKVVIIQDRDGNRKEIKADNFEEGDSNSIITITDETVAEEISEAAKDDKIPKADEIIPTKPSTDIADNGNNSNGGSSSGSADNNNGGNNNGNNGNNGGNNGGNSNGNTNGTNTGVTDGKTNATDIAAADGNNVSSGNKNNKHNKNNRNNNGSDPADGEDVTEGTETGADTGSDDTTDVADNTDTGAGADDSIPADSSDADGHISFADCGFHWYPIILILVIAGYTGVRIKKIREELDEEY